MIELEHLVRDFASAIGAADARRPIARSSRNGTSYQPGIGPHSESQTIELVARELYSANQEQYEKLYPNVCYPGSTRMRCDLCIGDLSKPDWAIEVKMLRFLGDNGKLNDNMLMHILSPYPEHRSAVTDCAKLFGFRTAYRRAVLIFGYYAPGWPLAPAIDAFEALASREVLLSPRVEFAFESYTHPVHYRGSVYGWELQDATGPLKEFLNRGRY